MEVMGWEIAEIDPGVVGRCAWEVEQARRDIEVLAWVGRFRFVTPRAISERFEVSWQQANARVRRLERLGLLGSAREHMTQPQAVFVTARGQELLGGERRRAPRADVQRTHEAAIVWLVAELERHAEPGVRVLTERECRQREAAEDGRYSVDLAFSGPRSARLRWPDVVVERPDGRQAIEIEFAPKGSERLKRIISAYHRARPYNDVVFYVASAALGRRIKRLACLDRPSPLIAGHIADVRVEAWPGLDIERHTALASQLSS